MGIINVNLNFDKQKLNALKKVLSHEGITVAEKLTESLELLYQQIVPVEQQAEIDAQIIEHEKREQAKIEAQKRFAVFHIHENDLDQYLTSDLIHNFLSAAHRYRLYDYGEIRSNPLDFSSALIAIEPITVSEYENYCNRFGKDIRIRSLFDFNLDTGTVSVCERKDRTWRTYNLHDVASAEYNTLRSISHSTDDSEVAFENALAGKEIECGDEDVREDSIPTMQM